VELSLDQQRAAIEGASHIISHGVEVELAEPAQRPTRDEWAQLGRDYALYMCMCDGAGPAPPDPYKAARDLLNRERAADAAEREAQGAICSDTHIALMGDVRDDKTLAQRGAQSGRKREAQEPAPAPKRVPQWSTFHESPDLGEMNVLPVAAPAPPSAAELPRCYNCGAMCETETATRIPGATSAHLKVFLCPKCATPYRWGREDEAE